MKNIHTLIITVAVAMATTSALAGDNDKCQKTTEKCGTKVTKPLKGYGHQCQPKENKCGGCGKTWNGDNGHGNNKDGVDSSNPGKSKGGKDSDKKVDDENKKWWKFWN